MKKAETLSNPLVATPPSLRRHESSKGVIKPSKNLLASARRPYFSSRLAVEGKCNG
jgi:hypothetical protein